jgi:hypothetical protein
LLLPAGLATHVLQNRALLKGAHVRPTLEAAKLHLHLASRQPSRPSHGNAAEHGSWRLSQSLEVAQCNYVVGAFIVDVAMWQDLHILEKLYHCHDKLFRIWNNMPAVMQQQRTHT